MFVHLISPDKDLQGDILQSESQHIRNQQFDIHP